MKTMKKVYPITTKYEEILIEENKALQAKLTEIQHSLSIIERNQPKIKLSDSFGEDDDGYHLSYGDYLLQCNDNGNFMRFAEILKDLAASELPNLLRYKSDEYKERYTMEVHKELLRRLDKGGQYGS